jgi:hypothetical protein
MEDGNFFGLVGFLLLLSLINIYDGKGILNLYKEDYPSPNKTDLLQKINELSWQYAWSTKPTCARIHALKEADKYKAILKIQQDFGDGSYGPQAFISPDESANTWIFDKLRQEEIEKAKLSSRVESSSSSDEYDANHLSYLNDCGSTPDSKNLENASNWMIKMQRTVYTRDISILKFMSLNLTMFRMFPQFRFLVQVLRTRRLRALEVTLHNVLQTLRFLLC